VNLVQDGTYKCLSNSTPLTLTTMFGIVKSIVRLWEEPEDQQNNPASSPTEPTSELSLFDVAFSDAISTTATTIKAGFVTYTNH